MPRTHPCLKGLAETRARADGEYARLTALVSDVTQRQQASLAARAACDQLIRKFDGRLEPTKIRAINGWQDRYGERGALGQVILEIAQQAYPSEISTTEVCRRLQFKFGLVFSTPTERRLWVRRSVNNRLNGLSRKGYLERLHDPLVSTCKPGRWRWIPPAGSSCDLATLAAQAGVPTTYAFDSEVDTTPATLAEDDNLEEDDLPR